MVWKKMLVEELQDCWLVLGQFLMCEWDDFCYFWVAIMSEALLKFLLKRIYGLKEDVG